MTSHVLPHLGAEYDSALIVKVGLFLVMVVIASFNRFRLMPELALAAPRRPILRQLGRTVFLEQGLGLAVLLVASFVGMTNPHM